MVAVEGADDMRNLLMVNHVWWLLQLGVRTLIPLCPLLSTKGEKRINRSGFSTTGHEGKNYIKYYNISKMPTASA